MVCLGASAGGLDALQRFFGAVGAPGEVCFVVLQHLSTEHKSMMAELLARTRIDFADYKLPTVMRRIERRLHALGCGSLEEYAARVETDADEPARLRRELLIPVTRFFRDDAAFAALRAEVIAPLVAARGPADPIRVWCAGVATGEEAYTVAMLLQAECDAQGRQPGFKVFATDVEPECTRQAALGHYDPDALQGLEPGWVERFFLRSGDGRLGVRPELRQRVLFATHNLLADAPFTRIDLALCRNTLIYLNQDAQERALRRLQYGLRERGTLMLGSSEALGPLAADFEPLDAAHKLFRLVRPLRTVLSLGSGGPASRLGVHAPRVQTGRTGTTPGLVEAAQAQLLRALPPSVLVDAQRRVLHAWGDSSRFLRLQPGGAPDDLSRLLNPLLSAAANLLLRRALAGETPAPSGPITVGSGAEAARVVLHAEPVEHAGEGRCALLRFEVQAPAPDGAEPAPAAGVPLDHLALSTGIATLFLGPQLEVQRYTAEATALVRLRPVDKGRPLTDIANSLHYPDLLADVQAAQAGQSIVEREVGTREGGWMLARMVGYRGPGDADARVVPSFIDISRVRDARRLQALIDSLPELVAVLDNAGAIRMVNFAWTRFAQENGDPTLARSGIDANYLAACGGSEEGRPALAGLRAVLEGREQRFQLTYPCHGPATQRWFVMHAVRLRGPEPGVIVSHFDVTPWATAGGMPA